MLPLQTNYLWVNKLQHPQIKPHLQQLPMFSDGMSDHIVSEVQKTCLCGNWYKCNSHWPTHFSSPNMRVCISQTATPSRAVRLGPTTPMGTGFGQRPKKKKSVPGICFTFEKILLSGWWSQSTGRKGSSHNSHHEAEVILVTPKGIQWDHEEVWPLQLCPVDNDDPVLGES